MSLGRTKLSGMEKILRLWFRVHPQPAPAVLWQPELPLVRPAARIHRSDRSRQPMAASPGRGAGAGHS